jgi:alpha-L-fucosidase 2
MVCSFTIIKANSCLETNNLKFPSLSKTWDEAMPLGNGMVGVLIWEEDHKLRISLDRADVWDLRPMENLNSEKYKFSWVADQWKKGTYQNVQAQFDAPYDRSPAPSKIPVAALEFDIEELGEINSVELNLKSATCNLTWENGAKFKIFVHATKPIIWYKFEEVKSKLYPKIVCPKYENIKKVGEDSPVTGQDLSRLGYKLGKVKKMGEYQVYNQQAWGKYNYQVANKYNEKERIGAVTISSNFSESPKALALLKSSLNYSMDLKSHLVWWKQYWSKSSIVIPDKTIEKQWYLEMYKFGAIARANTPPISLQAVWTADNGKLPPWKGDFHHDLNTQLSYWHSFATNHLDLENGFNNWLWKYKSEFEKYTKQYYQVEGLNVPGVTTLDGKPMGGWIQYSFGPTVSCWLAQNFYWHWRYSMDETFLNKRVYPWIQSVITYLKNISVVEKGKRKLVLSSSPEIHDNSAKAWFDQTTNFDLALIKWTLIKGIELAKYKGSNKDEKEWTEFLAQWPDLAVDKQKGLMVSPSENYKSSHRHFSHLMAIYPLGILDYDQPHDQQIIDKSVNHLLEKGSGSWVGYSFSWLANMQAIMRKPEAAVNTLRVFAENFCLKNSFHVNGEQHNRGFSNFKYRPFTLEGNFAFASAVNQLLIQSHRGYVEIFPALPVMWQTVQFNDFRTEGAFIVSAKKNYNKISISIKAEKQSKLRLKNPFGDKKFKSNIDYKVDGEFLVFDMKEAQILKLEN